MSNEASRQSIALLLLQMLAEIRASASDEQTLGFIRAVGARIAALNPVTGLEDDVALVAAMNNLWSELEWGHVSLTFSDEGVRIKHRGMPATLDGKIESLWNEIAPTLLVGIYDQWLQSIGGGAALRTWIRQSGEDYIELVHGP
ncbi:cellulose biosynthesis protein BcsD [Sphingomonas sp. ASY06-1R]|uniref:cellulose biosynthesis protein BcsD n=1 Tax=Sphingomonas sp. ASY06-1R TaxID=3445771 RepID=UPI003FA1E3EC